MATPPTPPAKIKAVLAKLAKYSHLTLAEACKHAKIDRETGRRYVRIAPDHGIEPPTFKKNIATAPALVHATHEIPALPTELRDVADLVAERKAKFAQKEAFEQASRLIPVKIKVRGAIGILHFGDPHVDDDGTDITTLDRHMELTRTVEGLFGANVGDTTNNWIGRLARLYAQQSTSKAEANQLAEWFLRGADWLYWTAGNHDNWSGEDDPLLHVARDMKVLYATHGARLNLEFPRGAPFRINAKHDFPGHSQWNPVHGLMKAFDMGYRDHLNICGHKHTSGIGAHKCPETGIIGQAVRVASYKKYDRYAKELALVDHAFSPCAVTVIDAEKPDNHPDRCKVFWEAEAGVDYLKFLRRAVK